MPLAYDENELFSKLIRSLCTDSPSHKTEKMALESSFINFLFDRFTVVATRKDVREMQFNELVSMMRAWSRAVAEGRYVV